MSGDRRQAALPEGMVALLGWLVRLACSKRCRCCRWRWLAVGLVSGLACLSVVTFLGSGSHEELFSRTLDLWLPSPPTAPTAPLLLPPAGAFLLQPPEAVCDPGGPFLLVLVASATEHKRQREAVRQSWGGARRAGGQAVRTFFVVGLPAEPGAQVALEEEARRHGDLIQGRFTDTYANLTRKTLALLGWATTCCPGARFVLKADDDVFVNLPALARHLATLPSDADHRHYLGRVHWRSRPHRNPASRHHVPAALYPPDTFPPYCSGTAYVLSAPAMTAILAAAPHLPLLPIEDTFIGLCAWQAGIAPRQLVRMAGTNHFPPDPCCYREVLFSVHGVGPSAMLDAWQAPGHGEACSPLQRGLGVLRCRLLAWWAAAR
ncbi:PREDICTED: beta-1,3-galactosyltransferase 4 [Gekko japonicus]|uniref:Hexosyltransferase n=1 Tax=Gekko japonicus TaxID=146911 RepID=A0ABM1KGT3_GEKJA|nr:PREDICTED: beta-1,3-galactosyltransferase 4 [Gekko japonicus]